MFGDGSLVVASFSLLHVVAILIALWIAFRFEARIAAALQARQLASLSPAHRTILWLMLGSIFAVPVTNLLGLVQALIDIAAPQTWGLAEGTVPTFWGSAPSRVFVALSAGTTMAVYASASLPLWRYFRDLRSPLSTTLAPSRTDRILIVVGCAGLINLIVSSLVHGVVLI